MASFSSLALTVLEICAFKVQKTGHHYEISKSGDKISKVLSFQNWSLSSCFTISPEVLGQKSSLTPF